MKFPKFQTVEWWIEQLKEMPPKSVVQVIDSGLKRQAMLSIYPAKKKKIVCIDVGVPSDD